LGPHRTVYADGLETQVPGRSVPSMVDWNGDGLEDLIVGNTDGELLLYANRGTAGDPVFDGYVRLEADGIPIDLDGAARSRPSVCDWNEDGALDVPVGAQDGKVHAYLGVPEPMTMLLVLCRGVALLSRRPVPARRLLHRRAVPRMRRGKI